MEPAWGHGVCAWVYEWEQRGSAPPSRKKSKPVSPRILRLRRWDYPTIKRPLWYRAGGDFRYGDTVGTSPSRWVPGGRGTTLFFGTRENDRVIQIY